MLPQEIALQHGDSHSFSHKGIELGEQAPRIDAIFSTESHVERPASHMASFSSQVDVWRDPQGDSNEDRKPFTRGIRQSPLHPQPSLAHSIPCPSSASPSNHPTPSHRLNAASSIAEKYSNAPGTRPSLETCPQAKQMSPSATCPGIPLTDDTHT